MSSDSISQSLLVSSDKSRDVVGTLCACMLKRHTVGVRKGKSNGSKEVKKKKVAAVLDNDRKRAKM